MDSKIEFAKQELRIENETQSSASQGLELQQIKKECTDDEYLNFTYEENVNVYFDVPVNNSNSDNSNIAFAEDKIYVKGKNDTSESLEIREIKSESIDGDECGQDVEFNFDVPAENNSNEIDNSQIEFAEEKIYVKKENVTAEDLEVQDIKSEFVYCNGFGQDVEYNLDIPAVNYSNESDNTQIVFEEVNIYVKKEIDTSESLDVQGAKFGGCNNKTTATIINTHSSRVHVREDRNVRSPTALQFIASKQLQLGANLNTWVAGNQSLTTKSSLVRHEHSGDKSCKCTVCDKSFGHPSHLTKHKRVHSGDKPYKCTVCDKAFACSSNLVTHKRIHSGDKPYKCTMCNKAFAQSTSLTQHQRTHSGDKPYKCTVCNKAFTQSISLTHHKRLHSGDKPYKCTVCNKTFAQSTGLTQHKRIHSGEKPYKCTVCEKAFARLSNLITHKRRRSGDKLHTSTV